MMNVNANIVNANPNAKENANKAGEQKANERLLGAGKNLEAGGLNTANPRIGLSLGDFADLKVLYRVLRNALGSRDLKGYVHAGFSNKTGYATENMAEELMTRASKHGIVGDHHSLLPRLAASGEVDLFLSLSELVLDVHHEELSAGRGRLSMGVDANNPNHLLHQDLYASLNVAQGVREALAHAQESKQVMRLMAVLAGDNLETYKVAQEALQNMQRMDEIDNLNELRNSAERASIMRNITGI